MAYKTIKATIFRDVAILIDNLISTMRGSRMCGGTSYAPAVRPQKEGRQGTSQDRVKA